MLALKINNPDLVNLDTFCKFVISILRQRAADTSKLNRAKVEEWDNYFKEIFEGKTNIPTTINIIKQYFNNLIIDKTLGKESYYILCDKNTKYSGLDTSVDTLANMINNGTLSVARYSIFDEIYEDVGKNLQNLYKIWGGK